jgi:uncharacterized membrane protein YjfL (UPF0719 family)
MHPTTFDDAIQLALFALIYAAIGVGIFGVSFWLMGKLAPFSLRRELEEDQNVAVGIVMAAVILGIALIIAAAID